MPTKRNKNVPGKKAHPTRSYGAHRAGRTTSRKSSFASSSRHTSAPSARASYGARKKGGFAADASSRFSQAFAGKGSHGTGGKGGRAPQGSSKPEMLLTRRNLLIGAGALGGIALVGGVGSFAIDQLSPQADTVDSISVPEEAVTPLDNMTADNWNNYFRVVGNFRLPANTLVWADNDTVAACLTPTDNSKPISTLGLLYLSTGNSPTVLSEPQGLADGFDFLDVRCSDQGMIWVESNFYDSRWAVYTARISGAQLENITKVDEGDANWMAPSIAAVDGSAFWQLIPATTGEAAGDPSLVKRAAFSSQDVQEVYRSNKPFATRITPADDGVVITPRVSTTTTYYQLTKLSSSDGSVIDQMTLPSSMTPSGVAYVQSGFSFCFDSIYNYGGGSANLGTYTPTAQANPYHYNDLSWFRFSRSPLASPSWCGNWFIVKSTTVIACVHFASNIYCVFDAQSGADDYGEYLVSSGISSYVVGSSQIISPTNTEDDPYTLVRVYAPIEGSIGSAFA